MSMIELELSEEEKAELLASLNVGLSDSTVTRETSTKSVILKTEKRKFTGPPVPVNRDGMGRYIPMPGGKPLSQCDTWTPGPAGYSPDYKAVCKRFPEFSMGEGVVDRRKKRGTPGPDKYDIRQGMVWGKCKKLTIKEKLDTKHYEASPGPAAYATAKSTLGGPKYSMTKAPKDDVIRGLVSSLADTPDKSIPGPNYRACSDEWLRRPQTFGYKPPPRKVKYTTPGPCAYFPKAPSCAPRWAMGHKFKDGKGTIGPGPAAYKRKSMVPGGHRFTMGIKYQPIKEKYSTPGPDQYSKAGFRLDEPGFTLQYRWFDTEPEPTPGPAHYRWYKDPRAKAPPAYTFPKCRFGQKGKQTPGPADYRVSAPPLDKGKTLGLRLQPDLPDGPGPCQYCPEKSQLQMPRRAPAYSLSGRHNRREEDEDEPGPSDYMVKDNKIEKPGRTIGLKLERKMSTYGPGPAAPWLRDVFPSDACVGCDCVRGVTVKSRHTPCKYSGFRNLVRLEQPRKDIPAAPLLG